MRIGKLPTNIQFLNRITQGATKKQYFERNKIDTGNYRSDTILGANNEHYEQIKAAFPKLKIVARGNEVKALGDEAELKLFEQKINALVAHLDKFGTLTNNDVDGILGAKKILRTTLQNLLVVLLWVAAR